MTRGRLGSLATTAIVLLLAALSARAAADTGFAAGDCAADPAVDAEEQAFLGQINAYRAANGLGSLSISTTLSQAAQWKSDDMVRNNYFAHDDLSRTWSQRIRDCAYTANTYIGENLAAGMSTAQAAFDAWKNSPAHNANMLNGNFTAIGIGRTFGQGTSYGWYWSTDFGGVVDSGASVPANTPAPPPPTSTPTTPPTATPTASTSVPTATTTQAPPTATPTNTPGPARSATASPTRVRTVTAGSSGENQAARRVLVAGTTRNGP